MTSHKIYKKRLATLMFLVVKNKRRIEKICLAMKKRGFGKNRWNGAGGKVGKETIKQAAYRETAEEIGVKIKKSYKVAILNFKFPHQPAWDQAVHVYFSDQWDGHPTESEEMKPRWFQIKKIPYRKMWPDDIYWLPLVLKGIKVKGSFVFGPGDTVLVKKVKETNAFSTRS